MSDPQNVPNEARVSALAADLARRAPADAARLLDKEDATTAGAALAQLPPLFVQEVLRHAAPTLRERLAGVIGTRAEDEYSESLKYPEDTVGRMMTPPVCVFGPETQIRDAVEQIRRDSRTALITYGFVVDAEGRLLGVVVMRDMLLGRPDQTLGEIMIRDPFALSPETSIDDAMHAVVKRHYPVYPVSDAQGRLLGLVQGYRLFEEHRYNLAAQAGSMVGASKEEHYSTPWRRCFLWRHPWLQVNLLTAFLAAAVVGGFEATISQIVALAVFLPVLAGQSGNAGVQALAVTVRGLTLHEFGWEALWRLLAKESLLGFLNGAVVGVVAAAGMWVYASMTNAGNEPMLALTVFIAMTGSCVISGISGVVVPLMLARLGADPASASGIFVTTCTDIASLGMFLGVATLLVM